MLSWLKNAWFRLNGEPSETRAEFVARQQMISNPHAATMNNIASGYGQAAEQSFSSTPHASNAHASSTPATPRAPAAPNPSYRWYHRLGLGGAEGRIAYMEEQAERLTAHTDARVDHIQAKAYNKAGVAIANQELAAAQALHDQHSWWGKTKAIPRKVTGKFVRGLGWTALGLAGFGILASLSSKSSKANRFKPEDVADDLDKLPEPPVMDFSTAAQAPSPSAPSGRREVLGEHTARVLGLGGNAMQPNLAGSDGASLIDGKPLGILGGPSPN